MNATTKSTLHRLWQLRALLLASLIWLGPVLACGSFAPRPTPTPSPQPATPLPQLADATNSDNSEGNNAVATPLPEASPATPTPAPTPTFTPTPEAGTELAPDQPARVTAPAGLNYRSSPAASAELLGQIGTGQRVTVLEGPVNADDFTWWRIDDGQGNAGWAAEGDGETVWISPQVGEAQPVNRSPAVGDRVQVTNGQLSVRATPGINGALLTRVSPGQQFTVLAGPQSANGYNWFQIRSDNGDVEGWAAEGDGSVRWLSPLE